LYGSATGSFSGEETLIARLSFDKWSGTGVRREIMVYNNTAFRHYKLGFMDGDNNSSCCFSTLEMYEGSFNTPGAGLHRMLLLF
jgi:hypothetical protein